MMMRTLAPEPHNRLYTIKHRKEGQTLYYIGPYRNTEKAILIGDEAAMDSVLRSVSRILQPGGFVHGLLTRLGDTQVTFFRSHNGGVTVTNQDTGEQFAVTEQAAYAWMEHLTVLLET